MTPLEKRTRERLSKNPKIIITDWMKFPEKEELKIFIKDILEPVVDSKYYLSEKLQERFARYLEEKESKICALKGRGENNEMNIEYKKDLFSNSIINSTKDNLVYTSHRANEIREYSNESPTLKTTMGTGGNNVPMVAISNCSARECGFQSRCSPTLCARDYKDPKIVSNVGTLRRLTPKECFRLQGFLQDDVDLTGLSDTQCYKLAGNGQSVNVVEKIFKQMF